MSLLSNPNVVRLGKYQNWLSPWYENNTIYSSLIYTDLYVNEFLNGIYYKLKVPTTTPIIRELGYEQLMISLKSYMSLNKKNIHIMYNYRYLNYFKFQHRKIFFYFRRILRNLKRNNNHVFKKNKLINRYKSTFFLFPTIFLKKNKNKIKQFEIKKVKQIKKINNINKMNYIINNIKKNKYFKLKYLSIINQLYYNLYNIKLNKKNKIKRKIILFIKKHKFKKIWKELINENKIKNNNKVFNKNILKNNKNLNKDWNIKNKKNIFNKIIKKNKIYKKNSLNKKFVFNLVNNIISYKYKRKLQIYLYKLKINKYRKNKLDIIKRKISYLRSLKRKRIFLKNKDITEKKVYNYYKKKNILLIKNTEINLLFQWFLNKIMNWLYILIIQSIIIFYILKGLLKNNDTKNTTFKFYFNWEKKIKDKIKQLFILINKNKLLNIEINNLKININFPLMNINNQKKFINLNIIKNKYNYSRLKSYYRLKKRIIRNKKNKEYELKYSPKIHNYYFRLVNTTKKWFKNYYRMMLINQLKYKIKETLTSYLHQPILFIYSYRESIFPRLDNPKILSDHIKFLMKKEEKIPSIFKKIVEIHSKQRKKCRKRSYFLMRLLSNFKSKILHKLRYSKIKYKNIISGLYLKKIIKKKLKGYINKNKQMKKYKLKQYKYNVLIKNKKNKILNINKDNFKLKINKYIRNYFYKNNNINKKIKLVHLNEINNINNKLTLFKKNELERNNRIDLKNVLDSWKFKFRDLAYKRYPLIGIRIEFNGPSKKGRRTNMSIYNEWVDFYTLPGKMPLVTMMSDIQYWQSYGLTQRAAIGIKLWMYFFSPYYSESSKRLLNKE